jgi:hypothetical protein
MDDPLPAEVEYLSVDQIARRPVGEVADRHGVPHHPVRHGGVGAAAGQSFMDPHSSAST